MDSIASVVDDFLAGELHTSPALPPPVVTVESIRLAVAAVTRTVFAAPATADALREALTEVSDVGPVKVVSLPWMRPDIAYLMSGRTVAASLDCSRV